MIRLKPRALAALVLLPGLCIAGQVRAQQEAELKDIRAQIKQKQKQVDLQLADAKRLAAALKQAELDIAQTARSINQTQTKLQSNQQRQKQLKAEQSELQRKQKQQQGLLAKQIRSAFVTGNHDYAKMLFNQEDAGKFERVLSYYQYLNKARKQQIDEFRELVAELDKVNAELGQKQRQLQQLQRDLQGQKQRMAAQQAERKRTLVKVEQSIQSEAASIEQLQINEQALVNAIEQAKRRATQQAASLNGLARAKGKLLKPTKGRVRKLFGARRQGQVRWKGVLINGNAGSPVKAVYQGKVLYADWLRGFGLVMVLDHGEGYMSLYGHNQALLKQAGDLVGGGETIALVGQSGGQSAPSLYFEIRHKGQAINPSKWLKL